MAGASILGGEPLAQGEEMLRLVKTIREKTGKGIWMWTGYQYEVLAKDQMEILQYVDVLVDGPFVLAQRDLKLKFRGSANQRILDLEKTREIGRLVLWEDRLFD